MHFMIAVSLEMSDEPNRIRHLVTTVLDVLFVRSTFLMLLTCSSVNSIEMVFLLISANYLFVIAQDTKILGPYKINNTL